MLEVLLSHVLFFFAGIGVASVIGAILLAHRDVRRLSTPEEPAPEPASSSGALVLTTGLYPALADLHEPTAPILPVHEWWLESTAAYETVTPKREPIPDPDVVTGRMRWGGTQRPVLKVVHPNGVDQLSPLTPDSPELRVCDVILAGAA